MNSRKHLDNGDLCARLLNWIKSGELGSIDFIAIEARYSSADRRADMLVVGEDTHAFEIKSDLDRLDRLPGQLGDYRRTFDYCTVVVTEKHFPKVRDIISKRDGLIVVSGNCIKVVQQAARNKKILKANLVAMCSKHSLSKAIGTPRSSISICSLRAKVIRKMKLEEIGRIARAELARRFKSRYINFEQESEPPYRKIDLTLLKHGDRLSIGSL